MSIKPASLWACRRNPTAEISPRCRPISIRPFLPSAGAGRPDPERGTARRHPFVWADCRSRWSRSSKREGDIDRRFARLAAKAPAVKQAEAKLEAANRDLAQAELDLRYCDIVAEIDGVVTRRNVNPGNNVQVGQGLMAIRSLTRDLGRRQFQGNAAARLAHRPAGRSLCRHVWRPTCVQGTVAGSRWGPDRRWRCCRRRTPRATSSKSCSGCRSGSSSKTTIRTRDRCSSALRLFPTSTSTSRPPDPMPGSFCKPMCLSQLGSAQSPPGAEK